MSQENVEAFKRGVHAYDRRDIDALLEELDPDAGGLDRRGPVRVHGYGARG